jgi:RNA polymerase sigma-70 factor (ECF subfamily)
VPPNPNRQDLDETVLVAALKRKDESAFATLVQHYQKRLFGIAYGITLDREESLDIVQETFVRVFQKIDDFREDAGIATWLYRITVNLSLNWKRRWKRRFRRFHVSLDAEDTAESKALRNDRDGPDKIYLGGELEHRFRQALTELPEKLRSAFILKELEGLSYEEIGRILNVKKGTVSSRLFNARQRLKNSVKPYLAGVEG